MSGLGQTIIEHLPLVHVVGATGTAKGFETKDLVGVVMACVVSAAGASIITTKELAVKLETISEQQRHTVQKMDAIAERAAANQLLMAERIVRLEEKTAGMNGSASERRPR